MHPSQTRETAFNKDEGKHGQREILERRDIRQVHHKRRVEVRSQNRDLLRRDVCTCLAPWACWMGQKVGGYMKSDRACGLQNGAGQETDVAT